MSPAVGLGRTLLALAFGIGCGRLSPGDLPPADDSAEALHRLLQQLPAPEEERARQRDIWLRHFYQRRDGQPAWTGADGVHARADEVLLELDNAWLHGLNPEAYGRTPLRGAVTALRVGSSHDAAAAAAVDVGLTAAFLALADDLRRGAVDPAAVSVSWGVRRSSTDLSGLLATAISLDQVGINLRRLAPASPEYRRLQRALVEAVGGTAEDQAPSAELLRANLERWRWLPRDLGPQYLLVRIAEFELDLVNNGQRQTRRVIVGEPYRQTPQFASEVTHVVVHPPWRVPPRIADEELAPGLDPERGAVRLGALRQEGFEAWNYAGQPVALDSLRWVSTDGFSSKYRLEQRPGGSNPLGKVKLELENPFSIYLHDTPGAGLFTRLGRDLSHGCVRVEGIVDLVRQLLQSSTSAARQFEVLLASAETGRVELPTPVPVYLLYWTVSVTAAGEIHAATDLYDVDRRLLEVLQQAAGAAWWLAPVLQLYFRQQQGS
ncbi:MAG: L,D-transpeptidase family protein [bacterium]|nr:L,D-transpeptidase family protein [bacterium]